MTRVVCGGIVLLSAFSLILASMPSSSTRPEILTVDQTMEAVFYRPLKYKWELSSRANPGAADAIRRVARDPDLMEYQSPAWITLGFVGDKQDILFIKNLLEKDVKKIKNDFEVRNFRAMVHSIGIYYGRDIEGAKELLTLCLSADFWETNADKWSAISGQSKIPAKYELIGEAADGYAISGKTDLTGAIHAMIESISDPEIKKYMQWRVGDERLAASLRSFKENIANTQIPKDMKGRFNGDMKHPGPADPAKITRSPGKTYDAQSTSAPIQLRAGTAQELASARELMEEATAAYEDVLRFAEKGEIQPLKGRVMHDGKILDLQNSPELWGEALDHIPLTQRLYSFEDVRDAKGVEKRIERQGISQLDVAAENISIGEVITVSWKLQGSAAIGKKYLPGRPSLLIQAEDGALIVVMKKIDGKWYWNPFGW